MSFHNILFPVDFSPHCRLMNKQVEWLAKKFGSRVTLLHVFEVPATWYGGCEASFIDTDCFVELRKSFEDRLQVYPIRVPEDRVYRLTVQGDAATEIVEVVRQRNIDLVVMGTRGYGALKGWLVGSVTAKVLHSTSCPVWTDSVRHPDVENPAITRILCALETSDETVSVLRFAKHMAEELKVPAQVVHSVPLTETRPNRYFDFDLHAYLTERARIELAEIQKEAGTEFPIAVSALGISNALAEQDGEGGTDLIITGRGLAQTSFRRFQTHLYDIIGAARGPVLSYSVEWEDRTSSSCNATHLGQSEADEPLLTGSRKS